ncbi:MAG: hypothetical protein ACLP07_17885 [Terracidiphilus sp.]
MPRNRDVYWYRPDVIGNWVSFYEETWLLHAEKHAWDKIPADPEHFYKTVTDPDYLRRSLDEFIGPESCVFEKFFETEQQRFFVPVQYEDVTTPGGYDQGGKKGRVMTGFFQSGLTISSSIGEIFWTNPKLAKGKDSE